MRAMVRHRGRTHYSPELRRLVLARHDGWAAALEAEAACAARHGAVKGADGDGSNATAPSRRSDWIPWSELLRRVFAEDALACPRCGGRMRVIAAVTSPTGIRQIREHLGLPARAPPLAPARLAEDEAEDDPLARLPEDEQE
jgi:hypothetical protein